MATTYSPTRSGSLDAERRDRAGRSAASWSSSTATSSRVSLPTTFGAELAVVGELDPHRVGVVDDVVVRDDVTLRVDDEARAEGLLLHDLVAVPSPPLAAHAREAWRKKGQSCRPEAGEPELAARHLAARARS